MKNTNTTAFYVLAWIGYIVSLSGMIIGLWQLEADIQTKGFFLMTYLFSIFSTFTLGKVIRDKQEELR